MNKVILFGGGGHAKVVCECLEAQGDRPVGFVDDNPNAILERLPNLGVYQNSIEAGLKFVISIGNNSHRKKASERISHSFVKVVHTSASVSPTSKAELGSVVFHKAIIQADSTIGRHVIVNTGAQIDHDCSIGDYAHIGPGAILCGNVTIQEGSFIGAGAVILPGIKIGKWAIIGAGSVVTKDIPDNALAFGNPAMIKNNK